MKLQIKPFRSGGIGIYVEQRVGERVHAAQRMYSLFEVHSNIPHRTLLYLGIRDLRRYVRRSIEKEKSNVS